MDYLPLLPSASPIEEKEEKPLYNNIFGLAGMIGNQGYTNQQISLTETIIENNRYYFISINRVTLSWMYVTFGIVQTMIDQPVDDAYRGGVKIKSKQLSPEEVEEIERYMEENRTLNQIKQAIKWKRLFGGAGIVINTIGNANKPLNPNAIGPDTPMEFYAADLWELNFQNPEPYGEPKPYQPVPYESDDPFNFYGIQLHQSRVLKMKNKDAPSIQRAMLRGWGMSEMEPVVRDINQFIKNQNVIFELLDEAKVDVWKMEGYNSGLLNPTGVVNINNTVQATNTIKNFQHAILMDKEDEYEQKTINFTGLAEMSSESRIAVASSLKMPMAKIFGMSAAGFNSGEDDIENYNTIVEQIRGSDNYVIIQIVKLISQKLFGFMPEDLEIEYEPLRILSATDESNVKNATLERILSLFREGLITNDQVIELCNAADLLPTKIKKEVEGDFPIPPQSPQKVADEGMKKVPSKANSLRAWKRR